MPFCSMKWHAKHSMTSHATQLQGHAVWRMSFCASELGTLYPLRSQKEIIQMGLSHKKFGTPCSNLGGWEGERLLSCGKVALQFVQSLRGGGDCRVRGAILSPVGWSAGVCSPPQRSGRIPTPPSRWRSPAAFLGMSDTLFLLFRIWEQLEAQSAQPV